MDYVTFRRLRQSPEMTGADWRTTGAVAPVRQLRQSL